MHHLTIKKEFNLAIKAVKCVDLAIYIPAVVERFNCNKSEAMTTILETVWLALCNWRGKEEEEIENHVNEAECIQHYIESALDGGVLVKADHFEQSLKYFKEYAALPEYIVNIEVKRFITDAIYVMDNELKTCIQVCQEETDKKQWFVISPITVDIVYFPSYECNKAQVFARNTLIAMREDKKPKETIEISVTFFKGDMFISAVNGNADIKHADLFFTSCDMSNQSPYSKAGLLSAMQYLNKYGYLYSSIEGSHKDYIVRGYK